MWWLHLGASLSSFQTDAELSSSLTDLNPKGAACFHVAFIVSAFSVSSNYTG
jgi:hypothetical protein